MNDLNYKSNFKLNFKAFFTLFLVLGLIYVLFIQLPQFQYIVVSLVSNVGDVFSLNKNHIFFITILCLYVIAIGLIVFVATKMTSMSLSDLNIKFKFEIKDLLFYMLVYLLILISLILLWNIINHCFGVSYTEILYQLDPRHKQNSSFNIIAPFYEEILFRGIVLALLLRMGLNWFWAIVMSAVVFMLAHVFSRTANIIILRNTFVLSMIVGLIAGYMFYKTRSLIGGIILHYGISISLAFLRGNPNAGAQLLERLLF